MMEKNLAQTYLCLSLLLEAKILFFSEIHLLVIMNKKMVFYAQAA